MNGNFCLKILLTCGTGYDKIESDSFITSANADYYEFRISDRSEPKVQPVEKGSSKKGDLPDLEPIE